MSSIFIFKVYNFLFILFYLFLLFVCVWGGGEGGGQEGIFSILLCEIADL